jgi:hypothetical protein
MTTDTPRRPDGIQITITDTQQVVLNFDHGDIPPIALSDAGARRVASNVASAADRVSNPEEHND